jgi:hypothetical protein
MLGAGRQRRIANSRVSHPLLLYPVNIVYIHI